MNRHLSYALVLVLLALVVGPVGAGEPTPARHLVPADAFLVMVVRDPGAVSAAWADTSLARLLAEPEMQRFFAPLRETLEVEQWSEKVLEATGHTLEGLLAMFSGEAVLYLRQLDGAEQEPGDDDVEMILLAGLGDQGDEVVAVLERLDEQEERTRSETGEGDVLRSLREVQGVSVRVEQELEEGEVVADSAWAVAERTLVLGSPSRAVEGIVRTLQLGEAKRGLEQGESFRTVADLVGASDVVAYLDLGWVVPMIRRSMAEGMAEEPDRPFDSAVVWDAMGLDVLRALAVGLRLDGGAVAVETRLTFTERRGLVKLMAYTGRPAPRPTYIPAEAVSFSTSSFSFQRAWSALAEVVDAVNPQVRSMMGGMMAERFGVGPEVLAHILESLGDEVASFEVVPSRAEGEAPAGERPNHAAVVVSVRDRETLEQALQSLRDALSGGQELFVPRQYLDTTIHTVRLPKGAGGPSPMPLEGLCFAVTERELVVGLQGEEAVEAMLARRVRDGDSVWRQPQVKVAVERLPAGAVMLQHLDLARAVGPMLAAMAAACSVDEDLAELCDPEAVPSPAVLGAHLGSAVAAVYSEPSSLSFRVRLDPPGAAGE